MHVLVIDNKRRRRLLVASQPPTLKIFDILAIVFDQGLLYSVVEETPVTYIATGNWFSQ